MNEMDPPPVLVSARVIEYAVVPDDVSFTDKCPVYVDGELLGRVPRLAIAENLSDPNDFLLLYCEESWNVVAIGGASSIEDVKRTAELKYTGIGRHWTARNISREEALAYYDAASKGFICSFCGRRPYELEGLIQGSGVQICRACVEDFYKRFNETDQ